MAERLAQALVRNGIEVGRAAEFVRVGGRTLSPRGTYIVSMDQPSHRLIRNLLDPHTPMDPDFVQRQMERRANRQRDEIYDVTAWSMPSLWDVELLVSDEPTGATTISMNTVIRMGDALNLPSATVGYLLPWGTNAAAAVAEALREGIVVRSAGGSFTLDGRDFGVGTAIVRTSDNGPNLTRRLNRIVLRHRAEIVPVNDSYVRQGMSLGSGRVRALREPRVLLVYDRPGSTYSVGWARYVLEQRYGQRTTAVRASSLGRVRLSDYDVIVFPSGNYGSAVSQGLLSRIQASADEAPARIATPDQPIDYLEAITPRDEAPEQTPGAIVRTLLNTDHWLASGTDGEIGVLVEGSRVFTPITLDQGTNVGRYAGVDELVMGGIVWDDAKPQMAHKAFLLHQPVGRGQVIAFAEDPNYRAYTEASQLLFINAVLLGPGR
jgi:hypothetical protein